MGSAIWYTARQIFDAEHHAELNWKGYIEWSNLYQLSELVSLDAMLNKLAFEPDYDSNEYWEYRIADNMISTGFFKSLEFVLESTRSIKLFNLIAAVKNPKMARRNELAVEFEFVGYELLDVCYDVSRLTNYMDCRGSEEFFKSTELNECGLINDLDRANQIQKDLKNGPDDPHSDCNVFEIWRHKTVGRKNKDKCENR